MGDAAVALAEHGIELDPAPLFAALTEQLRMPGGSVKALVEGRDAARQQLDLGVVDGAVFAVEVTHGRARQILGGDQIEHAAHLVRHQAQGTPDVGREGAGVEVGFGSAGIFGYQPGQPGAAVGEAGRAVARGRAEPTN